MENTLLLSDVEAKTLTGKNEKLMTLKEVADSLSCSYDTIKRTARKLGFTKDGVKTLLNEEQVTLILDEIKTHNNRTDLPSTTVVLGSSTKLTPALKLKKAMALAQEAYEEELERLRLEAQANAPKVEFYNQVTDSTDAVDMSSVAKVLNYKSIGRNKLFEILRNRNILQKDNLPYQKYIDAGYFRVIESKFTTPDGEIHINFKTIVYQSGINFIRKQINKQFKDNFSDSEYVKDAVNDAAEKYVESEVE